MSNTEFTKYMELKAKHPNLSTLDIIAIMDDVKPKVESATPKSVSTKKPYTCALYLTRPPKTHARLYDTSTQKSVHFQILTGCK